MRRPRFWFGLILIALVLAAACTQATKPDGPKFTGRLLFLSGDRTVGAHLFEISAAADGFNKAQVVASGIFEAVASPDHTKLLYATKDEITLRDLSSGSVKSLVKGQSFCLAWSPDGKRFSYKQRPAASTRLYISDLEGKTKLIWEDASGLERADARYCAQWMAPDRLVFERFVGMTAKPSAGENLQPNTTTVASISEQTKFADGARKWSIQGICPAGNVLVSPADQAQPIFVAKTTDHFEKLNPTPGPTEGRFIGFAANSCVPFFVQQPTSTTTDLFSLNPTNWSRLRTASITYTFSQNAKFLIKSSAKLMIAGDAPDKLLLIDTESGDVTPLAGDSKLVSPTPIVWIEN